MSHENQKLSSPEMQFPIAARVEEFLSASQNNDPFLYPGERPTESYITDGEYVRTISVESSESGLDISIMTNHGSAPLGSMLDAIGADRIEDRIPILAFGANMSPGSLKSKFTKVGRPDALVVPTIYGELPGHDIVWSGGPGVNGNFIAILYSGEETQNTSVQVGLNFLTREQLLVMHATELSYDLVSTDVNIAGINVRGYYYAGHDSVYLREGHPVAVESVPAENRCLEAETTSGLLQEMLQDAEVMAEVAKAHPALGSANVQEYAEYAEYLKQTKGARLELKKLVHTVLHERGKSKVVKDEDTNQRLVSWSNPSTIPTFGEWQQGVFHHDLYRLPTQEIPAWEDSDRRKKVIKALTSSHFQRTRKRIIAPKD